MLHHQSRGCGKWAPIVMHSYFFRAATKTTKLMLQAVTILGKRLLEGGEISRKNGTMISQ